MGTKRAAQTHKSCYLPTCQIIAKTISLAIYQDLCQQVMKSLPKEPEAQQDMTRTCLWNILAQFVSLAQETWLTIKGVYDLICYSSFSILVKKNGTEFFRVVLV